MSVAFAPHRQRGKGDITPTGIQKLLDENNQLIQCIMDFQSKGKTAECSQYQQMLHRNLVYLATIADSNQNMQSLLPAPPTQNMPMGPGGMNQSGVPGPQPPHGHNMPSEGMVSGGPPAPHMQSQMNGQMPGPNHMPMQGPGPGPNQPPNMPGSGSMNMPPSSHGSMGGYNHAVPSSQSMPAQGQMNMTQGPMGNYGPRPNMNMQANQGPMMHQQPPSQQYNIPPGGGGQHYQGQQNPMGMMGQGNHVMGQRPMPPYRPPQQERDPAANQQSPYEKDNGNAQYGQQQEAYQQGPPQQQGYPPQQQYPGQQGYPGPQQGYGPSQGAPGQYPQGYPQGQGQQYGAYRGPQPGPPQAQQQRPYPGYDQGQYGNYQQ
ncbi:protein SSXT isoform X11 [Oncorhynchus kisutch]|uniref:SS18 N-terminal domain-containing protein n=1 Tax=Oncorhynchus tshawytscha TaxID=74940 RepID=A0A8C8K667_ONCTS|nr:protein SSXT isoform X11 [Oncorhynchus kisutch]XP_035655716.1 protein SSXT-like isoform X7 [Oncorhynchus keta]